MPASDSATGPSVRTGHVVTSEIGSGYIPSLDGLRAVSIAIVFFGHLKLSNLIPGGFGVTVFFFLSGFLITTLLVQEQRRHGWIAIGAFYMRRAVRLGPPLLITIGLGCLAVLAGLAQGSLDTGTLLSQIFFYSNYYVVHGETQSSVSGLGILWSLAVEEHFYLFYPFVFIALARGWISLRTIFALLVIVLLWRMVRFHGFGHSEWSIYVSTDTRIDSILFGCLLALMHDRGFATPDWTARGIYPVLGLSVALLLASFLIRDPAFRSTFRYTLQGIALMPVFHFAVTRPDLAIFRPLNWWPVRRVGQYSYTLYLVHYVIINALIFNGLDRGDVLVFAPLVTVLSLLYAGLIFEWVEKPLKPLRARLTGHG